MGSRPQLLPDGTVLAKELRASFLDIGPHVIALGVVRELTLWLSPLFLLLQPAGSYLAWKDFAPDTRTLPTALFTPFMDRKSIFDNVDLTFVFGKRPPEKLCIKSDFFMSGTSVPVTSPSVFARMDKNDLKNSILETGLLHDTDVEGWTNWFTQSGLTPVPEMSGSVFQDFNLLRAAALSGQGVALCPLAVIKTDVFFKPVGSVVTATCKRGL